MTQTRIERSRHPAMRRAAGCQLQSAAGIGAEQVVGTDGESLLWYIAAAQVEPTFQVAGATTVAAVIVPIGEAALFDAKRRTAVDCIAPQADWPTAVLAAADKSVNCGMATAARMPRMTITTTSSIKVKPFCNVRFIF